MGASSSPRGSFATTLFADGRWNDNVFFHGQLEPEEVKEFLQGIDVLVCTSRDEALPITILEAMQLKKCVVATPVGGIPEIIQTETSGILVPTEDSEALAQALTRLVRNRALLRSLASAGHEIFVNHFSIDRYGRAIHRLVAELTGRRDETPFTMPDKLQLRQSA